MIERLSLPPRYRKMVEELLHEHVPEAEVWAYGSRINGESHEGSDLDLVLRGPGLERLGIEYVELTDAIRESNIPILVQVHDWARLPDTFHDEIEQNYVVVQEPASSAACPGSGDWEQTTLGGVVHLLSGGTPSKRQADYWGGIFPWVSAKDMKQFRLSDTEDHLTEDGVANGTRVAPGGSVLLLTRGMTLLSDIPVCVVRRPMAFNQDVKALTPTEAVDDGFLPYLILGNKHRLLGLVDLAGHGTGRLNSDELRALEVSLPPLEVQRAIARVLGALDDKIELSRRMSETLEEMARALFRSWFVDFDPVRAKAEGRPSGLPPDLDVLFPASFEASELGEIPAGWEVLPAGEAMTVFGGSTPSTKEPSYWGGEHCFATPKDLSALQEPILASTARRLTDGGVGRIRSGLLPEGTVLLSSRAPIGYLAVTETPVAINQGIIAMVCDGPVGAPYALHWSHSNMHAIETRASGTTFAEISKSSFRDIPFLVPPAPVHAAWDSLLTPLYDLVASSARRSRSLAAQRDTLLPRLISGTVRLNRSGD